MGCSRFASGVAGALIIGGALAVSAAAGAASDRGGAAIPLAPEQRSLSHMSGRTLVLRQNFTYGRQNTWVAGVRITVRGRAFFGAAEPLGRRLGGWECAPAGNIAFARHLPGVTADLTPARGNRCASRHGAVTFLNVGGRRARLVTDLGTIRIGQRWRSVPARLRARVVFIDRTYDDRPQYFIGRQQDPCNPRRPAPVVGTDTRQQLALAGVVVNEAGVVTILSVQPRAGEGVGC